MANWIRIGHPADEDLHHYINLDDMTTAYVQAATFPSGYYGIEVGDGTNSYDVYGLWASKAEADDVIALFLPGRQAQDKLPT